MYLSEKLLDMVMMILCQFLIGNVSLSECTSLKRLTIKCQFLIGNVSLNYCPTWGVVESVREFFVSIPHR